jgi:thymidylate synthase (FAD)
MYLAARTCYSSDEDLALHARACMSEADMCDWLRKHATRHVGLLEHVDFHFLARGVSRACTHQLVRHRIASYCQQSQRYVNMTTAKFVVPPDITNVDKFLFHCEYALVSYDAFRKEGANTEDARFLLPNATATNLVVKMNGRALVEASRLRLCVRAQWEIRNLFGAMQQEVMRACPLVGDMMHCACAQAGVGEGKCQG